MSRKVVWKTNDQDQLSLLPPSYDDLVPNIIQKKSENLKKAIVLQSPNYLKLSLAYIISRL